MKTIQFLFMLWLLGASDIRAQSVIESPAVWANQVGVTPYIQTDGGIQRNSSTAAWNAGATANIKVTGDGWVAFTTTATCTIGVGLSFVDPDNTKEIDYGIVLKADQKIYTLSGTTETATSHTYTEGTRITIIRTGSGGSIVQVYKDRTLSTPGTLIYTYPAICRGDMLVEVILYSSNTELASCYINDGDLDDDGMADVWERQHLGANHGFADVDAFRSLDHADSDSANNLQEYLDGTNPMDELSYLSPVLWGRFTGTASADTATSRVGTLHKTGTTSGYNADAIGLTQLPSTDFPNPEPVFMPADGRLVFSVQSASYQILGLGAADLGASQTDLEWGFITYADGTFKIYRPLDSADTYDVPGDLDDYNSNTVFSIQRTAGKVFFFKDNYLIYTGIKVSSGLLMVDCSLNSLNARILNCRFYNGDMDHDSLPDQWELDYADSLTELTQWGYADEDDLSDREEYQEQSNPRDALDASRLVTDIANSTLKWRLNPSSIMQIPATDLSSLRKYNGDTTLWNGDAVITAAATFWDGNTVNTDGTTQTFTDVMLGQSGKVSFQARSSVDEFMLGFNQIDSNRSYTDLDFAIEVNPDGTAVAYYLGSSIGSMGRYGPATRFSLRRVGRQVDYLKDGIVMYTKLGTIIAPMCVDTSFKKRNSEAVSTRIYAGDLDQDGMADDWEILHWDQINPVSEAATFTRINDQFKADQNYDNDGSTNYEEFCAGTNPVSSVSYLKNVSWGSLVGTEPVANSKGGLSKTSSYVGYNAGATGQNQLLSEGTFLFSANPTGLLAVGLTAANSNLSEKDIEYSIVLTATGTASVFEGDGISTTASKMAIGTYTANTIFCIQKVGTSVHYLKDGMVVYTSTIPSTTPLYPDCSINSLGHSLTVARFCDLHQDNDGDGLWDEWERQYLSPFATLADIEGFEKESMEPDNDGVNNYDEYINGTSPLLADTDGDGMSDAWEIQHGLAANDSSNATTDLDSDGLNNLGEFLNGTNPTAPDTDDDGMPDGYEVVESLLALDSSDAFGDLDGDRVPNLWEFKRGTSPSSAASKPTWDAVVTSSNENPAPGTPVFDTLQSAYNSLPDGTGHYAVILLDYPSLENSTLSSPPLTGLRTSSFDDLHIPNCSVALVASPSPNRYTWTEGPIVKLPQWQVDVDFAVNGLIFEGSNDFPIRIGKLGGQATRIGFSNCLFRDMQAGRSELEKLGAPHPDDGGALTLTSGSLFLNQCSFIRCSSFRPIGDSRQKLSAVSNRGGSLEIRNSIIWDDDITSAPSSSPIFGLSTIKNSIVQGSTAQDPALMFKGYPTALSVSCFHHGRGNLLPYDLHGQLRSQSSPTVGAVEWISADGDSLPDWWELWWFIDTSTTNTDITNPRDWMTPPPPYVPRQRTALDHYMAFTKPTLSHDGDNLRDDWEEQFFHNLAQVDTGNPDGDARDNLEEQTAGTDPTEIDKDYSSDGDDLWDAWEVTYFSDPPYDPLRWGNLNDPDLDGWSNIDEMFRGTNPTLADTSPDTDVDGLPDAWENTVFEVQLPTPFIDRPKGASELQADYALRFSGIDDCDQDGMSNLVEFKAGTNPLEKPYLYDRNEANNGPGNGLWDWWEELYFGSVSNARLASGDADGDGRSNEREMLEGTNPILDNSGANAPYQTFHNFSLSIPIPHPNSEDEVSVAFDCYEIGAEDRLWTWSDSDGEQKYTLNNSWNRSTIGSPFAFAEKYEFFGYNNEYGNYYIDFIPFAESKYNYKKMVSSNVRMCTGGGPADRLIVKAFRRRLEQKAEVFYILPGQTHASGPSCILPEPKRYMKYDYWTGIESAEETLDQESLPIRRSMPPSDLAGPRYRKIGLNGMPMPDSLPGDQNEGSALPEETFVDAYSRQLRHSTSDAWSTTSSSDLPVQLRRDFTPEAWSWRSGLRPDERPDRPFGPCWTSNLTPHIKLEVSVNTSDRWFDWYHHTTTIVNGSHTPSTSPDPVTMDERYVDKLRSPPRISLMDERGVSYSFTDVGNVWHEDISIPVNPAKSGFWAKWVASPDERYDAKTSFDTLTQNPPGLAEDAQSFTLTKRNGTKCLYVRCDLTQSYPQDRVRPIAQKLDNYYFRLDHVKTAQDNRLEYVYHPDVPSLIPIEIKDPARPNCKLLITQDKGRVTQITGPSEEVVHYHYSALPGVTHLSGGQLQSSMTTMGDGADNLYPVLVSVTREAQPATTPPTVLQEVKYEYSYAFESDPTPDLAQVGIHTYGHLELAKIMDERGHAHVFEYALNQTTLYDGWNGAFDYTRCQVGIPRLLTKIKRPDHTLQQPSLVSFSGTRDVHLLNNKTVTGGIQTVVSGACGSYTYKFSGAHTVQPRELSVFMNYFMGNVSDGDINEGVVYLSFTKMDITSAAGVEKYVFQPNAGMALSSVEDLSGNKTTFLYNEPVVLTDGGTHSLGFLYYDDPTMETSALHGEPRGNLSAYGYGGNHVGQKKYTYHPTFRTRTSMTDERGIKTSTVLDPVTGLPSEERVSFDPNNTPTNSADDVVLRRTTYSYTHPNPTQSPNPAYDAKFKSFLYRQVVEDTGFVTPAGYQTPVGAPNVPAVDMVTDYLPDINGRVWKQISYAGPVNLDPMISKPLEVTTTYTSGGQKQTVTDPRGNVTTFTYEGQTLRLSGTIFPGPGPVPPFKQLFYDAHGNIIKEVDETGNATLHEYDVFNRRTKTAVDLNNNGLIDLSYTTVILPAADNPTPVSYDGDIVTTTTYNAFNLPVDVTDPRGVVTHHDYDVIGRLIRTTVNATGPPEKQQITRFTNENGSITDDFVGGSVFDTKGFKPLQVTDPRGMVTTFKYDKAYQVRSKILTDTTYTPAMQVIVKMYYDDAGNAVYQQDPLNRITQTIYDGLNRPVEVHHPQDVNTPAAFIQTFYTPAGLVWRTLDEEGAESLAFHDYAGRKTHVYAPAVPVFDPLTQQTVMQRPLTVTDYDATGNPTHVHDPLGRVTETQYDVRNRPSFVIAPAVLNVVSFTVAPEMVQPDMETRYDAAGRVITVIDPLGAETHTHYDRAGRAYRVIAPQTGAQTHITRNKMDPSGNILQVIDAKEQVVTNVYDDLGRLITTTDHAGIANHFGYDLAGNRISVKDGLNQETVFTYDAQNRLRTQVFANTDTTTFNYNNVQKTSELKPDGITLTYGYDARDRLRTSTDSSASPISRIYTYDKTGRLKTVTQSGQLSVSLTYNALGWLTSETSSGLLHSYGYDLVGSRILAAYGTGRTVSTAYDALNRPLTITEGGRSTNYGYDLAGRAVSLLTGNGNFCWNGYDVLGRLKKRTLYADATAQVKLTEFDWDYDALGNVLSHLENWPGSPLRSQGWRVTRMTYDDSNRLHTEIVSHSELQLIHTTYTYDAAHNRQTKTVEGGTEPGFWDYNYNDANQLRTWQKYDEEGGALLKNAVLNYDANGNRTRLSVSDVAEFTPDTVYLWTPENRLLSCYQEGGDNKFRAYSYDYRCRRVTTYARTGSQPVDRSLVSFSGGLSVAEWESTATLPSVTDPPTVEYTRGPDMGGGVGGLLYSMRGTTPKFNLSNGRGDIVAQSDSTGSLTWTASYEAYGKRTKETGTNLDKQRANSKEEDSQFDLLNEGFRYRDLETGVWLSRDPAGFVDGPNLYAYVKQNPWTAWDPLGLADRTRPTPMVFENEDGSEGTITRRPGGGYEYGGAHAPAEKIQHLMNHHTTGDDKHLVNYTKSMPEGNSGNPVNVFQYRVDDLQARVNLGDKEAAETLRTIDSAMAGWALSRPQPGQHQGANVGGASAKKTQGKNETLVKDLPDSNGAVKPGQTGTYGNLKAQKRAHGETEALDMDHQPSFAAQVAAREAALGRTLTPAERAAVKVSTPAVASPRAVHQQTSPTYGGRNTPSRIAQDAADLDAAATRDRTAFDEAMKSR